MLLVALVLRAVSRALPPAAVLLGGLLRIIGIIALGAVIGFLGLAAIVYFAISIVAVATVLVLGAVGLALWIAAWLVAQAVVYGLRLFARVTDGLGLVLQRVIDVLMFPGKTLWNWLASFDRARELHIQPISRAESRVIRVDPGEGDVMPEAAAR